MAVIGDREMYGLEIARALGMERHESAGYSTLYRALKRLAGPKMSRLTSRLEPARAAERAGRPRRRLYRRTTARREGDARARSDGGQED